MGIEMNQADTAAPFLKGAGGVMRDLHVNSRILYISLHAARPSDELPKKNHFSIFPLSPERL
jgi:hypothetical protein